MGDRKNRGGVLGFIERTGNMLPHPALLFVILGLLVLILSWLGSLLDWNALHPATGEVLAPMNLLSREGFQRIITDMVLNFTEFAPLGVVAVSMLGIGIAESSGFISVGVRSLVLGSPKSMITFMVVLAGVLSNIASDVGYVLVIPLAGVIFHSVGKHPIAGMAAAFAGVSGGYSANLFISSLDPMLAGLSTEAAQILDPAYVVLPTSNYYFMVVSTVVITLAGTWVNHTFIEPRLGSYQGGVAPERLDKISPAEKKGMKWVGIACLLWAGLILWGLVPANGFFRGAEGSLLSSPLLTGFIGILFLFLVSIGVVFGVAVGRFRSGSDVVDGMTDSMKSLASFFVLSFFAGQFVAWFKWSNLGVILAVNGAQWLQGLNIGMIPLLILFVLFAALINLFIGSASAKWTILAPVFVPMFMLFGYSPELSQAVYRIGDSVTNIISPVMSYFALIIVYFEKYDKKANIGTIASTMLPYSVVFLIAWVLLLVVWILTGLPLGPEAGIYYR